MALKLNVRLIPKCQSAYQKVIKSNLNNNKEIRSVITFSLHISNSRLKPAGFDFQFKIIFKKNFGRENNFRDYCFGTRILPVRKIEVREARRSHQLRYEHTLNSVIFCNFYFSPNLSNHKNINVLTIICIAVSFNYSCFTCLRGF